MSSNPLSLIGAEELALILNIKESTINKLAKKKQIPCIYINKKPKFSMIKLTAYFNKLERSFTWTL